VQLAQRIKRNSGISRERNPAQHAPTRQLEPLKTGHVALC